MRVKESIRLKVLLLLDEVVQKGTISVKSAESVVGKLRYVLDCMGRAGVAATNPLTRFCHSAGPPMRDLDRFGQ
jgi:hypothetical protein